MKRKQADVYEHLPPVWLYLDDLEELVEKLQVPNSKVEIERERVSYDSVSELADDVKREISDLKLRTEGGHVFNGANVAIDRDQVIVSGSDEARCAAAILYLQRKVPILYRFPRHVALWVFLSLISGMVLSFGAFILIFKLFFNRLPDNNLAPLAYGCGFACAWLIFRARRSKIRLYKRDARPSFWEKNRDDIVAKLIVALVSAAAGWLFGRLSK